MYWISLLIHSAAILAAADLLSRIPLKLFPAHRYRLLLAGFALLLIWPLLSAIVPPLPLPFWFAKHAGDSVTVQQTALIPQTEAAKPRAVDPLAAIWVTGVLLALVPVAFDYLRVFRIARRATRLSDPASDQLLRELCAELGITKTPALLMVPEPAVPLTFGLRQPRILLSADYTGWPLLRQRTVLLHELAHVRRRDIAAQLFACVVTAIWWFQPLCWINRRSLRRESERACDALVLASGVRPSDYATHLFEIAHGFSKGQRPSSVAITMVRRSELESRLLMILNPRPGSGTKSSFSAMIAVLAVWSVAASAITLNPSQTTSSGGLSMKRTFLSGLLSSAGLSAATIGGSLFDPSGAAVSQAKASLYNPETKAIAEMTTTQDGKFTFDNLSAGQYILRVDKPGFASLFHEFNVQSDSKLERGLTLKLDAKDEAGVAQVARGERTAYGQSGEPRQVRIGGQVAEANLIKTVQPTYPASAKAAGVQGTVDLKTVISKDGIPEEITVVSSPSDDLTQSALEAVRQWRYRPTLLNGEPIDVVTDVIVTYTLAP